MRCTAEAELNRQFFTTIYTTLCLEIRKLFGHYVGKCRPIFNYCFTVRLTPKCNRAEMTSITHFDIVIAELLYYSQVVLSKS